MERIANSGKYDVENHIKTIKHRKAAFAGASSSKVTSFLKSASLEENEKKLATIEGCWAYHTVFHNQSFRSTDCTSKLIQHCFEPKYSSARTKTESIITHVLAPFAIKELLDALSQVHFITVFSDVSNHNATKVIPILVRFFTPRGVQVKILEIKEQPGETSDIISNYIIDTLARYDLTSKLLGISADNTNCNFGGASRRGLNNVFHKIKSTVNRPLIGIGCLAHIMNNCVKTAADCLPMDIEAVIVKIYLYFHTYTVRTEELKHFCEFVDIEYKKLLGYSANRWLALLPAIERILKMYRALKSYFASQEKCPVLIKNFFEDPVNELWLFFVHHIAESFHNIILKMEGQNISLLEVIKLYKDFQIKLIERRNQLFLPFAVKQLMKNLEVEAMINSISIEIAIKTFYST
ncbi:unnamed protein product [Brassicogethes aeneus]|uniref:Uncharacterized protein n=1 Tax=Brassicogethes aeneus TaxID=1431903 RepID=A0A9P0AQI9_BRAAE|nr:unnamed protein product [Brassicogethes aeneus]